MVCLGDYIYERNFYDGPRKDTLGANKDGEVQTLAEYRAKYRHVQDRPRPARDARLGTRSPAIWDDHEVEDNYAGGQPGRGDAAGARAVPRAARATATAPSTSTCRSSPTPASPSSASDLYRRMRLGAQRRAVPARRAPVPRRPALRRRALHPLRRGRVRAAQVPRATRQLELAQAQAAGLRRRAGS